MRYLDLSEFRPQRWRGRLIPSAIHSFSRFTTRHCIRHYITPSASTQQLTSLRCYSSRVPGTLIGTITRCPGYKVQLAYKTRRCFVDASWAKAPADKRYQPRTIIKSAEYTAAGFPNIVFIVYIGMFRLIHRCGRRTAFDRGRGEPRGRFWRGNRKIRG
jgi:hypothetical protein